ncbi:hypothetical protein BP5796_03295 [Coleophoma crateriformis]|uniref:Major facilitator superfamily (MFS) profile domain-containing protein n=1 Tax=Coleophoma crateriformis TaxID=565419 RepID=A0A3D8SN52_9HELO|nr:hypothetical protein BP5796_03295 [Coleophoma crateriformis]
MSSVASNAELGAGHNGGDRIQATDTLDNGNQELQPSADQRSGPSSTQVSEPDKSTGMAAAAPLVITLAGAAFLNTASITSIVIILPSIGSDLAVPQARQQWMASAYSLAFGCFLLLFGKLGDVFGRCLLFLAGGVWVTAFAIGSALSPTEICFDFMRAMQGLGAAANVPTAMGIIGATIPPGRVKNYAFAIYSAGAPVGAVMGNLMGGILGRYTGWRVVFYVLAACSAAITISAYFMIPKDFPPDTNVSRSTLVSHIDWVGALVITAGLVLLIFALSEGNDLKKGWRKPFVLASLILSILLLMAFCFWEYYLESKTTRDPLIPISLFKNKHFSVGMAIAFLFYGAFNNYLIYTTYFYQDYLLLSSIQTALRFLPCGFIGLTMVFTTGFLLDRVPANYILTFGLTSTCISCLLFAVPIPPSTTYWAYGLTAMILAVVGADSVSPCLGLFITQSLDGKDQALAGAMFNTVGQIGRILALAVATTVEGAVETAAVEVGDERQRLLKGLRYAQWLGFACCSVSAGFAVIGLRGIGRIGLTKKLESDVPGPVVETEGKDGHANTNE